MLEINKDRIFNESSKKVLIREFENLKDDYTKMNAIKYKACYENQPLSFIIENSRYIFSEPIKGCEFYGSIIRNSAIPFTEMEDEQSKLQSYFEEYSGKMSDTQKQMYSDILTEMTSILNGNDHSISMYSVITENGENSSIYYDALYRYKNNNDEDALNTIKQLIEDNDEVNLMDAVNVISEVPELYPDFLTYLKSLYTENPMTEGDYTMNVFVTNTIKRMLCDSAVLHKVRHISNMNLRYMLLKLGGINDTDSIDNIKVQKVSNYDSHYTSPEDSVNRIMLNQAFSEAFKEIDDSEKLNRLLCEKAIVDMNLSFAIVDSLSRGDDVGYPNSIIERSCVESTEVTCIPNDTIHQVMYLEDMSKDLENKIKEIDESYFSSDGSPGMVVGGSVGLYGTDQIMKKKKSNASLTKSYDDEDPDDDIDDKSDSEDREYAEAYDELQPPQKKNIFQRIQNKALDANVKFKKKVANMKRDSVDAKNAGKAVTKIPANITDAVKKQVSEWDEADDNRRKEYIIKPGYRKKYFKALKLGILHLGAININPILNIVLLICGKFSKTKDVRIRNELARELKAEIKVTEEKIEDAKSNGDQQQKYKLMRIKEKLDAELARVMTNSKYV